MANDGAKTPKMALANGPIGTPLQSSFHLQVTHGSSTSSDSRTPPTSSPEHTRPSLQSHFSVQPSKCIWNIWGIFLIHKNVCMDFRGTTALPESKKQMAEIPTFYGISTVKSGGPIDILISKNIEKLSNSPIELLILRSRKISVSDNLGFLERDFSRFYLFH